MSVTVFGCLLDGLRVFILTGSKVIGSTIGSVVGSDLFLAVDLALDWALGFSL